jgi:hypothetical protein
MGKYWTRSTERPSQADLDRHRVINNPQPGDRCGTYARRFLPDDQWACMMHVVHRTDDGGVEVYYQAGTQNLGYAYVELDQWKRYCRVGSRKEDYSEVKRGRKKVTQRKLGVPYRKTFTGDGTFEVPEPRPAPPPQPPPKPYDGPVCGCTVTAPYPTELRAAILEERKPALTTFTCGKPPHEGEDHWDPRWFIGWEGDTLDLPRLTSEMREAIHVQRPRTR